MRTLCWLIAVLAALASIGESEAAEYWPMIDGSTYHYVNDDGATLTMSINAHEVFCEYSDFHGDGDPYSALERRWTDPSGDVKIAYYSQGGFKYFEPDESGFSPFVTFLDLPLDVGKAWSTTTRTDWGGVKVYQYEVIREDSLTVPMGTFDVVVVRELAGWAWGFHYFDGGDYYLHRDVGPVMLPGGYMLVSIDGAPVPTQERSMGSVKSLFR